MYSPSTLKHSLFPINDMQLLFFTALSVINSHPLKIYKLTINK